MGKGLQVLLSILFLATFSASAQVDDLVIMTVNGTDVLRSEFEYAYNKNNGNTVDAGQDVKEYLQMFIDFKLKVAEAVSLGLDTLSSLKEEYKKDRAQMAEGYLIDSDFIVDEAYRVYAKDSATIGKDGFVKLCHIVFPVRQKSNYAELKLAKARIDSAYVMLQNGKTFEEVAGYFNIPAQALNPVEIVRGQAYPEFEKAAFTLPDGAYSSPIETAAGFHIVKRFSARKFGSFDEYKEAIIRMLEQQNIRERARVRKGLQLAKEYGGGLSAQEALAREDSLLESKYPEFGNLMREYYEGLLFFEVSSREVWKKASVDNEGLKKYFKKNRKRYKFDSPRFRGVVIQANSQENVDEIKRLLEGREFEEYKSAIDNGFPKDSMQNVHVAIGVFAQGDNAWVDSRIFGQGEGGKLRKGFNAVEVVGKEIATPEIYTDVKGLVASDYQKYLEQKWVKTLRKKYKVKVNKEVLKTVNNHD